MDSIKQWFRDLFASDSAVSSMRVASIMCVTTACIIALYKAKNGTDEVGIITALLTAGITGKVGQKWIESNDSKEK